MTEVLLLIGTVSESPPPSLPPMKGFLDKDKSLESLAAANS